MSGRFFHADYDGTVPNGEDLSVRVVSSTFICQLVQRDTVRSLLGVTPPDHDKPNTLIWLDCQDIGDRLPGNTHIREQRLPALTTRQK